MKTLIKKYIPIENEEHIKEKMIYIKLLEYFESINTYFILNNETKQYEKFDDSNKYNKITIPIIYNENINENIILKYIPNKLIESVKTINEKIYYAINLKYNKLFADRFDYKITSCILFIPKIIDIQKINFISEYKKKVNDITYENILANLKKANKKEQKDICYIIPVFSYKKLISLYDVINQIVFNEDIKFNKISYNFENIIHTDLAFDKKDKNTIKWNMRIIRLYYNN